MERWIFYHDYDIFICQEKLVIRFFVGMYIFHLKTFFMYGKRIIPQGNELRCSSPCTSTDIYINVGLDLTSTADEFTSPRFHDLGLVYIWRYI